MDIDRESKVNAQDKLGVLSWFEKNCPTSKHARTRRDILPFILMRKAFDNDESKDRYFRRIAHELIHEGHLCSHNSKGYWFRPLWTTDRDEIEAIKRSLGERKSKALAMICDVDRQLGQVERMEQSSRNEQFEFAGAGDLR